MGAGYIVPFSVGLKQRQSNIRWAEQGNHTPDSMSCTSINLTLVTIASNGLCVTFTYTEYDTGLKPKPWFKNDCQT